MIALQMCGQLYTMISESEGLCITSYQRIHWYMPYRPLCPAAVLNALSCRAMASHAGVNSSTACCIIIIHANTMSCESQRNATLVRWVMLVLKLVWLYYYS